MAWNTQTGQDDIFYLELRAVFIGLERVFPVVGGFKLNLIIDNAALVDRASGVPTC